MTKMNFIPNDNGNRDIIRNDIESNIFVEASAGSGKTTILVERMVNMVKAGIDISKISAITFTKAAANEFYKRFKAKLEKESGADSKCKEALKNIDLCFMGTIDAFCHLILTEHPTESGVPLSAEIIEDLEEIAIYRHFYNDGLNGLIPGVSKERFAELKILASNADEIFSGMMKNAANSRNARLVRPSSVKTKSEITDEIETLKRVLKVLASIKKERLLVKKSGDAWAAVDKKANVIDYFSIDNNLSDLLYLIKNLQELVLDPSADLGKLFGADSVFFKEHFYRQKADGYCFSDKIDGICNDIENYRFNVFWKLVVDCVEIACAQRLENGKLTFFDYLYYFVKLLKEDVKNGCVLTKHIFERHSYFLLDEFQDTNPIQSELFFLLTNTNPTAGGDWTKCTPKSGSLFIVGDPKQSIYRFRSADVSSFLKVKGLFGKGVGKVVTLDCNFRSTPELCDYFNKMFTGTMPVETADQSKYQIIDFDDSIRGNGAWTGVYNYSTTSGTQPDELVTKIKALVHNPNYQIWDKKQGVKRELEYKDFMCVPFAKTRLAEYAAAFDNAGIPTVIEGAIHFSDCLALVWLTKVVSVLASPTDENALVDLLINCYGIHESLLVKKKALTKSLSIFAENDGNDELDSILRQIKQLYDLSHTLTPLSCVMSLADKFIPFENAGTKRLEYLNFAIELLREENENGKIASLKKCSEHLNKLLKSDSEEERCFGFSQKVNAVHFANLHKVKGLEAPVVILLNSRRIARDVETRMDYYVGTPDFYYFNVVKKAKNRNITVLKNNLFGTQKNQEEASVDAENDRLMYVAATRAQNVLIVGCEFTNGGIPHSLAAYGKLIPGSEPLVIKCDEAPSVESCKEDTVEISTLLEKGTNNAMSDRMSDGKSHTIELPRKIKLPKKTNSEESTLKDNCADGEDEAHGSVAIGLNAALTGTLIHRLMELLATSLKCPTFDQVISQIKFEYEPGDEYVKMLEEVFKNVTSGGYEQENGGPQDILGEIRSAQEVHCELPFCYKEDAEPITIIHNGVMDLVYKKNDKWYIVDYKTNSEGSGLDEKYSGQLDAYVKAFKQITGFDAEARIYHINK